MTVSPSRAPAAAASKPLKTAPPPAPANVPEAPAEVELEQEQMASLPPLATLKCTLCQDYLKTPVTLPCLHTGCHRCFMRRSGPFSPMKDSENREPPPACFNCPVCLEEVSVPRDPSAIQPDLRVTRLIDLIQETRHLCDNCGELAEVACTVCTSSMCSGCFSSTHAAPVFASHVAKPLESAKLAQLSNCPEHGSSEMEFWCDTCSKGVCQVCLLKGSHKGHKYTPIRDVRNAAYFEIRGVMKSAMAFRDQMEVSKGKVACELETLEKSHIQVCDEIERNFEKIMDAVRERKASLIADATALRIAKEKALKEQMTMIDNVVGSASDAIDRSMSLVTHSNDLEIVERKELIMNRLKKMTQNTQVQADPVDCGTMSVALFNHINSAVAGYGAVRGTPNKAATAQKQQLEKLVSEADHILSKRTSTQALDGTVTPEKAGAPPAEVSAVDPSYCTIM